MNKYLLIGLSLIVIILVSIASIRFFMGGSEDTWLCVDGKWVQHGNPQMPHPENGCGEEKTESVPVVSTVTSEPSPTVQSMQLTKEVIAEAFSKKYGKPVDTYKIDISTDTGTFAKGMVGFKDEMGGGIWFAAKTAEGWELAADGQGPVTCDIANKYNFPNSIIPECIDTSNGNNLIVR